jgi:hypothetical protein
MHDHFNSSIPEEHPERFVLFEAVSSWTRSCDIPLQLELVLLLIFAKL